MHLHITNKQITLGIVSAVAFGVLAHAVGIVDASSITAVVAFFTIFPRATHGSVNTNF